MRIAVVSDDGKTISVHFGRARYYVVMEVEEGEIRSEEVREKPGHHSFKHDHEYHGDHKHGEEHGMGEGARRRHKAMTGLIQDCQVVLARGMGRGAYLHMQQAGIQPIITDLADIRQAVQAYLDGTLVDHSERLH